MPGQDHPTTEKLRFANGDLVALRADPSVVGAVTQFLPGTPEDRYIVFAGGKRATYYASQLQAVVDEEGTTDILPLSEFRARLTALQLSQPSLANLYSLHAARVNFVPYQFRPVLRFIRSDRPRLLIADEVGVGKTIEAGLILRELQARQDVRSVLIICPRPLVKERKWQAEMKRFDEEFVHLDGQTLRHCIAESDLNGEWPEQYRKCILPFSLFDERVVYGDKKKRQLGLMGLDPLPRFDLVIVDEAHHLRNPNTFLHQGVRLFTESAEAAVFLTATPIQLQSDDLFVLLNLLRPDVILDRQSFFHMSEPNPFIHEAVNAARAAALGWEKDALSALVGAGATPWGQTVLSGSAEYQRHFRLLTDAVAQERQVAPEARLQFIREAENLHTFASLINRTRRRDIGNFTTRKPETVEVEFTEEQRVLHDALLSAQERILRKCHGDRPMAFLMTTIRRQAASCLFGLAPLIEHILSRRLSDIDWETEDEDEIASDLGDGAIRTLREEIEAVSEMARDLGDDDPKRDALLQIVRGKQAMPNNKILLFSSFRHTLRYLLRRLGATGVRVGLIQGDIPDADRSDLRERFSRPKEDPTAIDVLLSSEVGCEGLDYQFCDTMVNYDLPWNPMRVEQRIGRIDRYGQKSETVAIYNLVTPGTVDFDIYTRCLLRIGLFRQALGGSEEVLGRITRELRAVAENLSLTETERTARLQQIADNDIRVMQEQSELEDKQAELFGIMLPPQQIAQEVQDASSAWLTPAALQNLIQSYLTRTTLGEDHFQSVQGEKSVQWLRLGQEARNRMLDDFKKLPRHASPVTREWDKYLRGSEQRLEVTFDTQAASDRRGATFITPIHPLAQQAAAWNQEDAYPFRTAFAVSVGDTDGVAAGAYPFAIFQWLRRGVRDDALLQPVCANPVLTDSFLGLLERAQPAGDLDTGLFPEGADFDFLESAHYSLWSAARSRHQEETDQVVRYRRESLKVSHAARVRLLSQQRDSAAEEKIRRMRGFQIANAEADYGRRLTEIDDAAGRADILTKPVAHGVLYVQS